MLVHTLQGARRYYVCLARFFSEKDEVSHAATCERFGIAIGAAVGLAASAEAVTTALGFKSAAMALTSAIAAPLLIPVAVAGVASMAYLYYRNVQSPKRLPSLLMVALSTAVAGNGIMGRTLAQVQLSSVMLAAGLKTCVGIAGGAAIGFVIGRAIDRRTRGKMSGLTP
jgi:hypothetical protein